MTAPAEKHPDHNHDVACLLCDWFFASGRDLPWRQPGENTRRDPYRTLVSEFMLQQTQVSRVLEYFEPFVERFETVDVLARAREQTVLSMWSGLGYYRRAKNLHAAARAIQRDHESQVPSDVASLLELPGVGRYTAGAIASLAFDLPEPIVDGNISRVLMRLGNQQQTAADASAWTWRAATDLVQTATHRHRSPGNTNEALMELGATVCSPRGPSCGTCPLKHRCAARKQGTQEDIPQPKERARRSAIYCASVVVTDPDGRVLLEKRPSTGMWADMWQAPTLERDDRPPSPAQIKALLGTDLDPSAPPAHVGTFQHQTTHRDVHFSVYTARLNAETPADGRTTKAPRTIAAMALSNAQRKVISLAGIDIDKS
jgi:A/G-specific adenine glycosylase